MSRPAPGALPRYAAVAAGLVAVFLGSFLAVEQAGVALLTDPGPWLEGGGISAAMVGVGLLVADVALPVPSSLVMVAHGALFGVLVGTLLSLAGSVAAAALAFAIGRRGGRLLHRLVPQNERLRADAVLQRWGALAIVISRPVPMLAETVAILAGTSPLGWGRALLAAALGSLPPALVYAITGTMAATFGATAIVFGLVLAVTAVLWRLGRPQPQSATAADPA